MSLALGPVARFMTRALYSVLETRRAWCDILSVPTRQERNCYFGWSPYKSITRSLFGTVHLQLDVCTQMQVIQAMEDAL